MATSAVLYVLMDEVSPLYEFTCDSVNYGQYYIALQGQIRCFAGQTIELGP